MMGILFPISTDDTLIVELKRSLLLFLLVARESVATLQPKMRILGEH
jgi:hypothetical protein